MFKEIIQKLKTWRKDRQQLVAVPDPEPETETPVEEIPGDVLALDDPEGSYGEGIEPECWQWSPGMHLRNGEVQLLQEKDPTEHSRELATLYGIGITADEAAERLRDLGKAITDALKPFVDAMRNMWECLPKWYRDALALENEMKEIATPRQWHLYKHGTPRQQKKWAHALARKAKIRKKRQGGDNR